MNYFDTEADERLCNVVARGETVPEFSHRCQQVERDVTTTFWLGIDSKTAKVGSFQ